MKLELQPIWGNKKRVEPNLLFSKEQLDRLHFRAINTISI